MKSLIKRFLSTQKRRFLTIVNKQSQEKPSYLQQLQLKILSFITKQDIIKNDRRKTFNYFYLSCLLALFIFLIYAKVIVSVYKNIFLIELIPLFSLLLISLLFVWYIFTLSKIAIKDSKNSQISNRLKLTKDIASYFEDNPNQVDLEEALDYSGLHN